MKYFLPVISFLFFILLWGFLIRIWHIPGYILPAPVQVMGELQGGYSELLRNAGVTLLEAVMGFLIGNGWGFLVAVGFSHFSLLRKLIYPYAIALKTTPLIAVAPLLRLWLGTGFWSKVAVAAVISFFPMLVNGTQALRAIESNYLDVFRSFSASGWQIFTKLRLPSALPQVFSALKISSGLSVLGAIVGEFLGTSNGLGYIILVATYQLDTARVFAAILVSAILGIAFFGIISAIERRVVFWKNPKGINSG